MNKYIVDVEAPRIEGDKLLPSDSDENANQIQLIREPNPSRRRVRRSKKARRINSVDYSAPVNHERTSCSCSRYFLFVVMIGLLVVLIGMVWIFFDIKNEMDRIRVKLNGVDKDSMERKNELNLYKRKFEKIDGEIKMLQKERNTLLSQISTLENKMKILNSTLWEKWQESEKIPHHFWSNITKKSNISRIVISTVAKLQYRVHKLANNTNSAIRTLQEDTNSINGDIKSLNISIEEFKAKYQSVHEHSKPSDVETDYVTENSELATPTNTDQTPTKFPVNPTTFPASTMSETSTVERRDGSDDTEINHVNVTKAPSSEASQDIYIEEVVAQLKNLSKNNQNGIQEIKADMEKLYTSLSSLKMQVYSTLENGSSQDVVASMQKQLSNLIDSSIKNLTYNVDLVEKRVLKLEGDVNTIRQMNISCEQGGITEENSSTSYNGTLAGASVSTAGNKPTLSTDNIDSDSSNNSTIDEVTPKAPLLTTDSTEDANDFTEENDTDGDIWTSVIGNESQ